MGIFTNLGNSFPSRVVSVPLLHRPMIQNIFQLPPKIFGFVYPPSTASHRPWINKAICPSRKNEHVSSQVLWYMEETEQKH